MSIYYRGARLSTQTELNDIGAKYTYRGFSYIKRQPNSLVSYSGVYRGVKVLCRR